MDTIEYIQLSLLPAVNEDVVHVAKLGLGRFGVPRSVFSYADHLGHIAFNLDGRSTERSVKFISEFFPARYAELAELIVWMWRHAIIHEHMPRSLRSLIPGTTQTIELRWLSTTHDRPRERGLHLLLVPIKGEPDVAHLVVNNPQLGDDFISAIRKLSARLKTDPSFKSECDLRVATVGVAQSLAFTSRSRNRDALIEGEAMRAWGGRGGLSDQYGNILVAHPDEPMQPA